MVRELRQLDVQIDVVPRLVRDRRAEGPRPSLRRPPARWTATCKALPLLPAPQAARRLRRGRRDAHRPRAADGADRDLHSPRLRGPILFRQRRLGYEMRPFTVLKFRTMRVDTDETEHRRYIERTMTHDASPNTNGLYKLDRSEAITRVGRVLRKTSLDELPQLFNILRGDMSLVGPRPCLDYETEGFAEHHFDRFLVPPGLTGLWQVTARSRSTFGEALDMDVAYVRGWSLAPRPPATAQDAVLARPNASRRMTASLLSDGFQDARVRTAVVGLGYWGPNLVRNLQEIDEADVVWACDARPEALEKIGRRYPAIGLTSNFDDVLARPICRGRRDCNACVDPLRPRDGRPRGRQARLRREAAGRIRRRIREADRCR